MRSPDPSAEFSDMAGKALTVEWLVEHADSMKVHYQGIGHSVSPQEIGHVNEYLTRMVLGR